MPLKQNKTNNFFYIFCIFFIEFFIDHFQLNAHDFNQRVLKGTVANPLNTQTESEFNEFKARLKSTKNRFQLSTGLNLETLNTIFNGTSHI